MSAEVLHSKEEKRSVFDWFGKGSRKWIIPTILIIGVAGAGALFINKAFLAAPATF